MKVKNILMKLLFCSMVAGCLAGCGQNEVASETKESSSSSEVKSSEVVESTVESSDGAHVPITTEPITISILLRGQEMAGFDQVEGSELWWFKYLEWWMNEQGYNITLEVTNATDISSQLNLMLASGDLPDIVWGFGLNNAMYTTYGVEENLILDWSPYTNEECMPNLMALDKVSPDALTACTALNGGVYTLPTYNVRGYGYVAGNNPNAQGVFVNKKWMEECDVEELPENYEEFLDMLRAFKEHKILDNGQEVVPYLSLSTNMTKHLWNGLGYYNFNNALRHGNGYGIKDGELQYMAMTEDYRIYIETMKTMYDEGLISQDYLTLDGATTKAMIADGRCGVIGCTDLVTVVPDNFSDWVALGPITAGDNDQVIANVNADYQAGLVWASADTEYPEVLAYMLDYVYSEEGAVYYHYGPMKGQDPLELLDGWFINENGELTYDAVVSGEYASATAYLTKFICPRENTFNNTYTTFFAKDMAGVGEEMKVEKVNDAVLGDTYDVVWMKPYNRENADGYGRCEVVDAYKDNITRVVLPGAWLPEEDNNRAGELDTLLAEYISAESAKFITGLRPISEIEAFQAEIKEMGAEEYIQLYRDAYSSYMDSVFN